MYSEIFNAPFPLLPLFGSLFVFFGIFSAVGWIMPQPYATQPAPVKFYISVAITSLIIHIAYLLGTVLDPNLLAFFLGILGVSHLWFNINEYLRYKQKYSFLIEGIGPILLVYLGIFFLFVLGPITDGDTIAYHAPVAVESFKSGAYPVQPLWFSSRLSGSIESFAVIFVALKFEQFGHLLNFIGLVGILWVFFNPYLIFDNVNRKGLNERAVFFGCIFLISPILIQLIVSWKPSLFVIFGLLCITILIKNIINICGNEKNSMFSWCLIIGIVLASTVFMRISYILPICLILLFFFLSSLTNMTRKAFFVFFYIGFSFVICFLLGLFVQSLALNIDFFDLFLNPFVSAVGGGDAFRTYLKNYSSTGLVFPFSIFVPPTLGELTSVVSFTYILVLVFSINIMVKRQQFSGLLFLLGCCLLYFLFLPSNARFWLEIFVGIFIYACAFGRFELCFRLKRVVVVSLLIPAIPLLVLGGYFGYSFFSDQHKALILERHAFGYAEAARINKHLDIDDVIYSFNRPMLFLDGTIVSNEWNSFVSMDAGREHALGLVESYNVDYVVDTWGPSERTRDCLGEPLVGPFQVRFASRNPLTIKPTYNVGVFDAINLKDCF